MSNGGSGTAYTASEVLSFNHDTIAHVYTATIYADDSSGKRTTVTASGSATQATNIKAPVITNATITPATVRFNGGTATVSATITSFAGFQSVYADIFMDGVYWTYTNLTNSGTSSSFTGNFNIPVNYDFTAHVFTAVVYATDNTNIVSSRATLGTCIQATDSGIPTQLIPAPTISSFTPTSGPVGQTVTINGTKLAGAIAVAFNGLPAASYTIVSAIKITAVVANGTTTGKITVVTPGGTAVSTGSFTVVPPPTITSFTPTSGGVGTLVTITGTNFTGASAVKFNGTSAVFSVDSATKITATVAIGTTTGKISVTTVGGTATSIDLFTFIPAPTIFEFMPTSGGVGTEVSIFGTDFTGATAVAFHGTPAASFSVVDNTTITAIVAAGTTTGTVSVTTSGGTATSADTMVFTFFPTPTITNFTPASGGPSMLVTITGTDFSSTTDVKFNGAAASFTVVDNSTITATVPSDATTGPITVYTMGGTATSATDFTFYPAPTIFEFMPTSGGVGTEVGISGTGFTGATAVDFHGTPAASFTVVDDTNITAVVAAGTTTGVVSVTTPGGTATSASSMIFTFFPTPTITGFAPSSGGVGTTVTISGTDFSSAIEVTINGTWTPFITIDNSTISATVAIGTTSGVIKVTTMGGTVTSSTPFTMLPPPTITSFTPTRGGVNATITVNGKNFINVTNVKFNGINASSFTVLSAVKLTAVVATGTTTGKISVTTPGGTATSVASFSFIPAPIITSFTPASGAVGTLVSIYGSNLTYTTAVKIHGVSAVFTVVNSAKITATVAAGTTTGKIAITASGGSATSVASFIVTSIPTITSITPAKGPVGTVVTINGTNFTDVTAVKFNGTPAASFTVVSTTTITASVASGTTAGLVTVTTLGGTATSATTFTPAPIITSFTPTSGGVGTTVTINGSNFTGTTVVKFNGTNAASFTVVSNVKLTAIVATGTTSGKISITTPGGTVTSAGTFSFIPAPTITSFSPSSGAVGTLVTIYGTTLTSTSSVRFNGISAAFTVVNSGKLTATVATGTTTGLITVTTLGGTATSATAFTAAPTITSFTPANGGAGSTVTINGNDFTGVTAVKFNGTNAASFSVDSAVKITAVVATGTTSGKISVTNAIGTATSTGTFSFIPAPTITSFTPTSGMVGTLVSIYGTTLTTATLVEINGVSAAFTVVNSGKITATVVGGTKTGNIKVTTAGGTVTSTGNFTFYPAPTITSFTPDNGPAGTMVTITGTNFTGATAVKFNGFSTSAITIVNDTTLQVIVPVSATTGLITVVTPGGSVASTTSFTVTP